MTQWKVYEFCVCFTMYKRENVHNQHHASNSTLHFEMFSIDHFAFDYTEDNIYISVVANMVEIECRHSGRKLLVEMNKSE